MNNSDTKDRTLKQLDRRDFIKTAGFTAAALGGIEGILAARRAPAFAQGTKLHWVRWVDFIPESDVELKRQMPEASKALGAEVVLETINANDLQARITAAIQSSAGADIFNFQYNWAQLMTSTGNSTPSLRRPERSSPIPIGRARGRWKYSSRCLP